MATGISRLSFETYKSWESVRCVFAHNHRLSGNPNSDPAKAGWNVVLKGSPADDLESLCLKRIAADSDPRANPMAGIVLGVSPGFFRPGRTGSGGDFCPERVRAWARAAHGWAEGRFGDNLVSSVLHLDEITPHIHLLVLPLDADGKLRMTALLKGRNCLSELHSGYAWALSGLGVERPSRWQLRFDGKLERNYYPFVRALALAGPPPTPEPEEPGSPRAQPLLGPPVPEPSLEGRPPLPWAPRSSLSLPSPLSSLFAPFPVPLSVAASSPFAVCHDCREAGGGLPFPDDAAFWNADARTLASRKAAIEALSRLDEIRARLDGLRIAHLRWKELEVKITSGMARDFPLESLVHTPSPAEVLEAREAFLLKSAGAPAAVREGPKAVQRGAPGRRGGARKGAHRPGSGPAPRPEDFGCCEVGSEAGRGGGNRSEACGAEGTREEAYGRLAGAGGAVGMGEETGRTDADGLFRLNDGLAVLCSGCSWRTQGGSGPPEGGNGAISLLCYLDGQDVSLPGRAVESACELAEIVGRAKAARALASHWAGESPGFAMALLALERSGPPPSERDWPGARARLCAETGITVQQAEWLKRGKVLYADRTGAVVFTRLERGSAVPPVGADPRDGWEAPEAGRAGGGEAQEAGYASGGEAQEAGRAGGGEAQEAGRAGDGEAPEAGYASGGEAQEAGRTGDGEAPEAGYTSGGEAQEAGRAGGGEAPEAGLAGGGEAPEAGLAGGGEAPEAGYASGWEAQEAGLAGGGEAPEAGRAGGGEAPEAGRASRTQSIGGREGPATPSARRSEEYAPKNRDQNHDWHLDRSREAGAADGRGDAGVPGTAGWPRAELEPGGGAAAGQKFPGPAPAAWRGEARPRFPAPPEFRPPLIRNGGQAGVQRRSFRAVKTADGYELVRLGPAPGLVVISGYPGEITFTRDPFRALAFKAAGCAGQVAVLPRGNAEESLGGRTFRTKRLFFATSLDERDREAVRRLAELPRENEGAADYLVHSTASPEPGRNYG